MSEERWIVLVRDGTWEGRLQASSLAASAVAVSRDVDLALFFGALAAWIEDRWDEPDPESLSRLDPRALAAYPPLSSLLEPGRAKGQLRIFACSASVRLLGADPGTVDSRVDEVLGWPSLLRLIDQAERVVSI